MLHIYCKHRAEAKIKINFCPMCGRKLKEVSDEKVQA
jgi:uncharacterized protein with PIN domain